MRKKLPIGKSDFKEVISRNFYYVDKTMLIEELLEKSPEVLLLTRPRRFGKTISMSMLKYFFDIRDRESNKELFRGLNIEKTEHISHQGKYPVIFITMKDIKGFTYEDFLRSFIERISDIFEEHKEIREKLDGRNLEKFDEIWYGKESGNYGEALRFLSLLLYKHYGVKPVLLIDEYDAPMIEANEMGYYEKVQKLISSFYGSALKDGICSFAVVTGILRIAKESIFSTLNNLDVSTILTEDYEHFGMKEEEVIEILKYYGWETTLKDTQNWYNGYLFGKTKVYNPWSILNHCKQGKLDAFWVGTSANTLIKEILRDADEEIRETMHTLVKDGKVKVILDEYMTFGEKYTDNTLLYLMFSAGYLTIDSPGEAKREYYLTIPNYEVKEYFSQTFIQIMTSGSPNSFRKMEEALLVGDIPTLERLINRMFLKTVSYFDISKEERFYHNIIMVMMSWVDSKFNVYSNRESGLGRYDLTLEPKDRNGIGYIFEFKAVKKELEEEKLEKKMDRLGLEALEQIERKRYEYEMRDRGIKKIMKIGMVFSGKISKLYVKNHVTTQQ